MSAEIEKRKAQYEQSALKQLMDATGHEICERCYCCDSVSDSAVCWQCNGFDEDDDDGWLSAPCSVCGGEGRIYFKECLGRCDENGNHAVGARSGDPEGEG